MVGENGVEKEAAVDGRSSLLVDDDAPSCSKQPVNSSRPFRTRLGSLEQA